MIELLPNEKRIASIDNDSVLLTDHRLQLFSKGNYRTIQLKQISFIEIEVKHQYILLALGCLTLTFGATQGMNGIIFGFVGLILFVLVYGLYPKRRILVRSSGGTIAHGMDGIKHGDIQYFVHLVQKQMGLPISN